jgi:N-formylglutamate amidohydrolase
MVGRGVAGALSGVLGIAIALMLAASGLTCASPYATSRFGEHGYIEYTPGSMPLILTIPHGGTLEPAELPDRISGTLSRYDTNTLELGRGIAAMLFEKTGRSPFLIITHVHRKKLDTNRDVLEAAQDDPAATRAWEEYHQFIDEAKRDVAAAFGAGLMVDLHGHRAERKWVELGYLLTEAQLALPDDSLNEPDVASGASIGSLVAISGRSLSELLRGPSSLGALFEAEGYEAVPSPSNPHPGGEHYFSGGYNTERHGSLDGGRIVAVQMETPWRTVRDSKTLRGQFARAAARALNRFLEIHFSSQSR